MLSASPSMTVAVVVTFERAIATDGTTATFPPAAPVLVLTVAAFVVEALTARSCPPVSVPRSSAVVVSSMTATPTDAPTPTEPTPVTPAPVGNASVALVVFDAAAMRTSPVPAWSVPARGAAVGSGVRFAIGGRGEDEQAARRHVDIPDRRARLGLCEVDADGGRDRHASTRRLRRRRARGAGGAAPAVVVRGARRERPLPRNLL